MTIVCGTDFSENAAQAIRAAACIARCANEKLELVHVLADPAAAGVPALGLFFAPVQELLGNQAAELAREFSIQVEPIVLEGPADQRLVELARGEKAKMIVISSLGTRKKAHPPLGSVAERVLQRATVPVLVVREATPIVEWTEGKRRLRILLGVDLGESARAALRWVETLRQIRACDVRVVQVCWPIGEHARFDIKGPVPLEGLRPELHALLERDLHAWTGELAGEGQTTVSLSACWGRFDEQLAQLAEENKADLLVVGTHQRAWAARVWHGSISRGVVQRASCNVACVPRSPEATAEKRESAHFRSVLIPTDFSALSNRALSCGYGLLPEGGEVHLVYVRTAEGAEPTLELNARLRSLIPKDAESRGIETRTHVIEASEPWSGIERAAARLGVDAICMATHGRSGAARLFAGSQAEEVVRRVRQPVLLVKGDVD